MRGARGRARRQWRRWWERDADAGYEDYFLERPALIDDTERWVNRQIAQDGFVGASFTTSWRSTEPSVDGFPPPGHGHHYQDFGMNDPAQLRLENVYHECRKVFGDGDLEQQVKEYLYRESRTIFEYRPPPPLPPPPVPRVFPRATVLILGEHGWIPTWF